MIAGEGGRLPKKCTRLNDEGQLPTCTQVGDGEWSVSYPDPVGPGDGISGGFAVLFVLALFGGAAATIWKVSTARRMARESGMDQGDATAMTLLTDDGFEATYLASNLRDHQPPPTRAGSERVRDTATRLRELDELREQGLITVDEHADRRRQILDSL